MKTIFAVLTALLALARAGEAAAACTPYWNEPATISLPAIEYRVADFNEDARADVAAITDTTVMVALTNANGTSNAPVTIATGAGTFRRIRVADVTGDQHVDIIVSDTTAKSFSVLAGHGDGTFGAAVTTTTPRAATEFVIGDFTGDQKIDIAWANYAWKTLDVWSGNNLGTFQQVSSMTAWTYVKTFVAGDFDKDGKLDLFAQLSAQYFPQ
ncbi:MAG TPA: VCBS repeat-containing protein, partial [Thermoanaerobaculia bacterium]